MDLSGVEPWLRLFSLAGIFAACAALAAWANLLPIEPRWRVLALSAAALATIPPVVVAPFEGGTALTLLALLSVAAFVLSAGLTLPALRASMRRPDMAGAPAAGLSPDPPKPQATRVATFSSVTAVSAQPLIARTEAIGIAPPASEIAFLVEYSGDGRPHRLGRSTSIGRSSDAGIVIESSEVSREHAVVKLEDGHFVLHDLGTTNGTHLLRAGQRRKVTTPTPLTDLDIIELGPIKLAFLEVPP